MSVVQVPYRVTVVSRHTVEQRRERASGIFADKDLGQDLVEEESGHRSRTWLICGVGGYGVDRLPCEPALALVEAKHVRLGDLDRPLTRTDAIAVGCRILPTCGDSVTSVTLPPRYPVPEVTLESGQFGEASDLVFDLRWGQLNGFDRALSKHQVGETDTDISSGKQDGCFRP